VERAAGAPGLSEAVLQGLLRQGEARRSRYRQVGGLRDGHQDIAATLRALQDGEDKLATLSYLGEWAEEPPVSRVPGTEAPRWEAEEERQAVNNQLEARANAAAKAAAEREVAAKVEQEAAEREAAEKEAAAARKIFGAHAAPIASGGEEVVTQEAKPKEHIESFASMGQGHLDKMRRQLENVPAGPQRQKLEKKLAVMERKVEQMQSIKEKQTSQESGGNAQGQGQNFDHLAPLANILMEAQEEDSSSEEEE
jgi:flagellar biosynthesis GTPase FlhF